MSSLESYVSSVIHALAPFLPQPVPASHIPELIDACHRDLKNDFAKTVDMLTTMVKTTTIEHDLGDDPESILYFPGIENIIETFIKMDPILIKRNLCDLVLCYIETLYKFKRPNPQAFDYLIIRDHKEVIFRAKLRDHVSGYSLCFDVDRLWMNIENNVCDRNRNLHLREGERVVTHNNTIKNILFLTTGVLIGLGLTAIFNILTKKK
jgi:hypothetical protein